MALKKQKLHKYTQNYPSERKDYPTSHPEQPKSPEEPSFTEEKKGIRRGGYKPVQGDPNEGGKISPDEAERISSGDLPPS